MKLSFALEAASKTFAGNVPSRAIIGTEKKMFELFSLKFSNDTF